MMMWREKLQSFSPKCSPALSCDNRPFSQGANDTSLTGHRHWPDEVKAQIFPESLRPGVAVNEVAESYGFRLSTLRTMARQADWFYPAPEGDGIRSSDH